MPRARPPLPPEIKELIALVRAGKLFEVQRWIAEGKPTTPPKPYWTSPLRVAMETEFCSMVEVLLDAGVEQDEKDYMLCRAVWDANIDLVKILMSRGGNVHEVEFDDVCRTGNPILIRYMVDAGINVTKDDVFARALQNPRRPLLGIYLQYRDQFPDWKRQIDLALRYHVKEGSVKWIHLLLWAGADPHVQLPDIGEGEDPHWTSSALEEAVQCDRPDLVKKFKIDPKRDDLQRLLELACFSRNQDLIEELINLGANPFSTPESSPMKDLMRRLKWDLGPFIGYPSWDTIQKSVQAVLLLADLGVRWVPDGYEISRFRKELLKHEASKIEKILRDFAKHHVCSNDVFLKLLKHPKLKMYFQSKRYNLQNDLIKLNLQNDCSVPK